MKGRLMGYELLFRDANADVALINDAVASTNAVVERALGGIGLDAISSGKDCYLNCTTEFLQSPVIDLLPPDRFVLEILETCKPGPALYALCKALRAKGFRLALDDVRELPPLLRQMLPVIDIVKLDWLEIAPADRLPMARELTAQGIVVLAEKIEDAREFELARDAGCQLFQGYYFSRPEVFPVRAVQPHFAAVLDVMHLLMNGAPYRQLADALLRTPALLAQLLRLASSGAVGQAWKGNLGSIDAALMLVGTERLLQWCGLLMYSDRLPTGDDPLAQLALERAGWMRERIEETHPDDESLARRAVLAGSLSLLHVAHGASASTFWQGVRLADDVHAALVDRSGPIGQALADAESNERQCDSTSFSAA
ncbi:EAL and HDOD domain-containing protein [Paraburkholderia acidisoli]|uniref:EAL domain-containing protein n=1 Tax=Paraburkholderia acidisoli TaxID=2571748 RepID=A0A7Z2GRF5_9BURK|nr:EAL domain-containing protein [Paraburkholderia acidisoli]QGZ66416.1 EAL domain-containing protein [Paraburkholderia acidisoli]